MAEMEIKRVTKKQATEEIPLEEALGTYYSAYRQRHANMASVRPEEQISLRLAEQDLAVAIWGSFNRALKGDDIEGVYAVQAMLRTVELVSRRVVEEMHEYVSLRSR